ncbi:MAG: hypothetical protein EB092_05530 [Chitinophagia bacterium]|nr:hypothetical protein [Chitinophagia bacterium]NCA30252.1 hypothetical protein [Chitinophagia bacterium]NDD16451.1 hypothetical protein [Chitinophagia bacterium]
MTCIGAQAQFNSYVKNLEAAVQLFDKSQTKENYELVYSKMEEISKQAPNEWLPAYYASIIKARMALKKMGNPDALADQAIQWLNYTKSKHNSDEVLCLESLVYSSKMSINPVFRWKAYEARINKPLEQAMALNKNNPRSYILKANIIYKMPILFGGGCADARPLIQKAKIIFDTQKEEFNIMPHWGRPLLNDLMKACPID